MSCRNVGSLCYCWKSIGREVRVLTLGIQKALKTTLSCKFSVQTGYYYRCRVYTYRVRLVGLTTVGRKNTRVQYARALVHKKPFFSPLQLFRGTKIHFPCSAAHEQQTGVGKPYQLVPYSAESADHNISRRTTTQVYSI